MSTTIESTKSLSIERGLPGVLRSPRFVTLVSGGSTMLLGLARVRDESYWMDETVSAAVVSRSFAGLTRVLYSQEAGMLPYYVGLWGWAQIFHGDAGLRMFSVLGATATAMLVSYLAARWYGNRVAWLASALLITNPFFLRYLTELRAYSWLMFISVAMAWTLDRAADKPSKVRFAVFGAVCGAGIAVHVLFVVVVVIALTVAIVFRRFTWQDRRSLLVAAVAGACMILPAVPAMVARGDQLDWLVSESFAAVRAQALELYGGILTETLLLAGLVGAGWAALSRREPLWPTVNAILLAVGFQLVLGVATLVKPMFVARYLAPAFPYLILAAAVGLEFVASKLLRRELATLAVALIVGVCLVTFVADRPFTDRTRGVGPREAVEFIDSQIRPGDQVVIDHFPLTILHYLGYRPDIDPGATPPDDDVLYPRRPPIASFVDRTRSSPRVYYVLWDPKGPDGAVAELASGRHVTDVRDFGDTTVFVLDLD
jgi:mannosyltransferase